MQDEREPDLLTLFHERSQDFPEEPFTSDLLKRIQKYRSRRVFSRRLVVVCGAALFAIGSPALINGSILLSDTLNAIFNKSALLLDTPTGILAATLCALLILFFNRRRVSRLV
jgi:hypothetical protein